jgi:hypothetical protein
MARLRFNCPSVSTGTLSSPETSVSPRAAALTLGSRMQPQLGAPRQIDKQAAPPPGAVSGRAHAWRVVGIARRLAEDVS